MSRLIVNTAYLDEANGNTLLSNPVITPTVDHTVAGPTETLIIQSPSNDDLSQSLSEYTDADESISAPTELLAEFLSAVMLRDYVNALKYCKLILQYEPNNSTARDFYPHILSKLASEAGTEQQSGESDENYNFNCSTSSSNSEGDIDIDEVVMICSSDSEQSSNCSSFLDYSNESSSASDEELMNEKVLNQMNCNSTTDQSDQLPPSQSATDNNTSHSYSSLLLEEEEKDLSLSDVSNLNIEEDENGDDSGDGPQNAHPASTFATQSSAQTVKAQPQPQSQQHAQKQPQTTSTPLASKLVAMLRARVIPSKSTNND
ncbi:uncharacterized protein LOC131679782 [Topomyia yanbarensis]|uniref:uncharacterized protein LOC131679782 n=1 Tax=Topomyia yanbarensis TaxID=2498891 RepID=UPI00273C83B7|nr:uncharacterized protein LOC131679782 [Topomyia yanbarensis]